MCDFCCTFAPEFSRDGGIGRHEGLKILWPVMAVRVQVPLAVQKRNSKFSSLFESLFEFLFASNKRNYVLNVTALYEVTFLFSHEITS